MLAADKKLGIPQANFTALKATYIPSFKNERIILVQVEQKLKSNER